MRGFVEYTIFCSFIAFPEGSNSCPSSWRGLAPSLAVHGDGISVLVRSRSVWIMWLRLFAQIEAILVLGGL